MLRLTSGFWGRPTGDEHGRPSCRCGASLSPVIVLPATQDRGPVAERRCLACDHVVHVPVPAGEQPREDVHP